MTIDPILLSRAQFGFTLAFHILFPALNIGLAAYLALFEALWLRTGSEVYLVLYRFWVKLFALAFGIGVVSGLVLSYEFGTNFSGFSAATGNVVGPLMSYEVLTAFFLESGFLGIMLFGWSRVGRRMHFFATLMVALGTVLSAFWILAANSWMQTPAGFVEEGGRFYVADWWAVIFNPSFPYRLAHMVLAALLTTSFVILGISAFYLLLRRHQEFARAGLSLALTAAAILAPLQIVVGDQHGLEVRRYQPVKLAAIEAIWHTERGAPLHLFALPDQEAATNRAEISIPHLGSLILTHEWNGEVKGLDEVPPGDRPVVWLVFLAFRIMVGIGFFFLFLAVAGVWLRRSGRLFESRWFLALCVPATPLGFLAVVSGWIVVEAGRQPWVVQGLLRTADTASPIALGEAATSLALFFIVYNVLLLAYLFYAARLVWLGPEAPAGAAPASGLEARPFHAAE
jgi:cytochrome d ubiquinol oxidase subunit I